VFHCSFSPTMVNSWYDSLTSKAAGFFAVCVAFLPTAPEGKDIPHKTEIISTLHYVSAGIFLAALAFMSLFLFTKSKGYKTRQKKQRNNVYKICGIIMLISIIGIPFDKKIAFANTTLVLETSALISFGFSWLTKGELLLKDSEEEKRIKEGYTHATITNISSLKQGT
jgi:hypothetical protein